jgi:hypothetical protein
MNSKPMRSVNVIGSMILLVILMADMMKPGDVDSINAFCLWDNNPGCNGSKRPMHASLDYSRWRGDRTLGGGVKVIR